MKEIEIWSHKQILYAQSSVCPEKCDAITSLGFWDTNRSPNLGQTTWPYNKQQQKKRTCRIVDFSVPADQKVKLKETEKKDNFLDLVRVFQKAVVQESDDYTNCNWYTWYNHRRIGKGTGGLGNNRVSGDHPEYCSIEIGQNTEKSPGDLRKLAVTKTPVWKTLITMIIIIHIKSIH